MRPAEFLDGFLGPRRDPAVLFLSISLSLYSVLTFILRWRRPPRFGQSG